MKRVAILLFTVILTIFSCEESDIDPTLENYRLSRILNYSSSTSSQPYGSVKFEYDDRGNLIKESMLEWPSILTTYKVYEYADEKKTKTKTYDGQVGNLRLGTFINYYYTNGNVTKEELYLGDGTLKYTTYYEFDGGDNLINTYKVDDNVGIHHQYKYLYDMRGLLMVEQVFMYDQELDGFTKYYYDNNDRMIKCELYDREGVLGSYIEKVYHGSDKLPDEQLSYNSDGQLIWKSELTYDGWGNLIGCTSEGQTSCRAFSRKYKGQLLIEAITYHPYFGCEEWTVTKYEYEPK